MLHTIRSVFPQITLKSQWPYIIVVVSTYWNENLFGITKLNLCKSTKIYVNGDFIDSYVYLHKFNTFFLLLNHYLYSFVSFSSSMLQPNRTSIVVIFNKNGIYDVSIDQYYLANSCIHSIIPYVPTIASPGTNWQSIHTLQKQKQKKNLKLINFGIYFK